jgi:DNA-3-methyladenine glycosylase
VSGPSLPPRGERLRLLDLLRKPAPEAARALLGQVLVRRLRGRELRARIVEAEAYLPKGDPGAHVFRGRTPRVAPLFGPPGSIYVYFVYGMHHCLNLAVDEEGVPGCALIRAAELLDERGRAESDPSSCRGPARLCRTLGLSVRDSGANLFTPGARLTLREGAPPSRIGQSRRIGLRAGENHLLRFFDAESAAVSGPGGGRHRA